MIETSNYINDDERQAWLTSVRAWGAAFPQFADLVARIEARLLDNSGESFSKVSQIGEKAKKQPPAKPRLLRQVSLRNKYQHALESFSLEPALQPNPPVSPP